MQIPPLPPPPPRPPPKIPLHMDCLRLFVYRRVHRNWSPGRAGGMGRRQIALPLPCLACLTRDQCSPFSTSGFRPRSHPVTQPLNPQGFSIPAEPLAADEYFKRVSLVFLERSSRCVFVSFNFVVPMGIFPHGKFGSLSLRNT